MAEYWTWLLVAAGVAILAFVALQPKPKKRRRSPKSRGAEPAASKTKPEPSPAPAKKPDSLPKAFEQDGDEELTLLTLHPLDEDTGGELPDDPEVVPLFHDEDAIPDEPTRASAFILVSAVGQTDQGLKRRRNEDTYLLMGNHSLFVVADGMGGYAGGDVASATAVEAIMETFDKGLFAREAYRDVVPRRGAELAQAIQAANARVYDKAQSTPDLREMGTTVVAARFSEQKQRVYIGHVGDSRCYRLRGDDFSQITSDHTMAEQGISGPFAGNLTRAVGIAPQVSVDIIMAKPRPGDVYLLCSDGLTKMVSDEKIKETLQTNANPDDCAAKLIESANESGGKDNTTVIIVKIERPTALARS